MTEFLFFTQPLALFLLTLLPVFWFVFRLLPLRPRRIAFPAYVLLNKNSNTAPAPRDIPLWLKILRLFIVFLFILAIARPVYDPARNAAALQPTVFIIDNDWSAAAHWPERMAAIKQQLSAFIEYVNVPFHIVTTAPDRDTGEIIFRQNVTAAQARRIVSALRPEPWPPDYQAAEMAVKSAIHDSPYRNWQMVWFGSGMGGKAQQNMRESLSVYGPVTLYDDAIMSNSRVISNVVYTTQGLEVTVKTRSAINENIKVAVYSKRGTVISEQAASIISGKNNAFKAYFDIPDQLLKQAAYVQITPHTIASTWYLNTGNRIPAVGLWTEKVTDRKQDYLNDAFYLDMALRDYAQVIAGDLARILKNSAVSTILMPDSTKPAQEDYKHLKEWVERGGTLIRFAGPHLAVEENPPLLPVKIYNKQRSFGGDMSMETPMKIGGFSENTVLSGLTPPADAEIRQQVLARPDTAIEEKEWVWLSDNTPFITADERGRGRVILVHTTADTTWSDFVLSQKFPVILNRLVKADSVGESAIPDKTSLVLRQMINADGLKVSPNAAARPVKGKKVFKSSPSPQAPSGVYAFVNGSQNSSMTLPINFGERYDMQPPVDRDYFDKVVSYKEKQYYDLSAWLFILAAMLLVFDALMTFALVQGRRIFTISLAIILLTGVLLRPVTAFAQQSTEAVGNVPLAYVKTGNESLNAITRRGLENLGAVLAQRTTIEFSTVKGVLPGQDDMTLFPLIYWPVSAEADNLAPDAVAAVQYYLDHGGMIIFDTRDAGRNQTANMVNRTVLQNLTKDLNINSLIRLTPEHVLTRSYYLLDDYNILYDDSPVWVENAQQTEYDGVPAVVITAESWAEKWAAGNARRTMADAVMNGPSDAEMAYRFGVNLSMMALTGSYKTDQVHIKYILERFERDQ